MNLSFFSRFSRHRKTNAVFKIIDHLRRHPIFRRARIDVYTATLHPQYLIVLFGQAHTVFRGKIGNRERNMIVRCQARLCSYYAYFQQFHGVTRFGGEGMYDGLETSAHDRSSFQLYEEIAKRLNYQQPISGSGERRQRIPIPLERLATVAQSVLAELGKQWHRALREQSDGPHLAGYAAAVSGQSLLNFLNDGRIQIYPIEGERAYQHVLRGITHLGDQVARLEETPELRMVKQRRKVKSEKEAEIVRQYNTLVKEFNRLIGSDIRERATLEIVCEKAKQDGLVVFTMGTSHRRHYLRLANEFLHDTPIAFLFITPPELLINWWLMVGVPVVLLVMVVLLGYWL